MARSDARLIFGSRNSNPLTSFLQGRELKRQREREDELFEMAKEDRQREQTIQDEDREAARAANEAAAQRQRDLENLQSITAGAVAAKPLLDDVETLPQAIRMFPSHDHAQSFPNLYRRINRRSGLINPPGTNHVQHLT